MSSRRKPGDAFGVDFIELHRNAEGNSRHDGELVRGVDALDVEGRVGLGIAQFLRLLEHCVECQALVTHFRKDEVAGAIDDAGDPFDAIGGQSLAQRLDDGNAARHRRLERNHHAFLLCCGKNFVAVGRKQRLVRGNDMLTVLDGLKYQLSCNGITADQLHYNIDIGIRHNLIGITGNDNALTHDLPGLLLLTIGNHADDNSTPGSADNLFLVTFKYRECPAADSANAKQPDIDGFHIMGNYKLFGYVSHLSLRAIVCRSMILLSILRPSMLILQGAILCGSLRSSLAMPPSVSREKTCNASYRFGKVIAVR